MKKSACSLIFLFVLLIVATMSARDGFCYAFKGIVYVDLDDDGRVDRGEGLEGVTVTVSTVHGSSSADFTTGPKGFWRTNGPKGYELLGFRNYTLEITLPDGYTFDPDQTALMGIQQDGDTIFVSFDPETGRIGRNPYQRSYVLCC